MNKSSTTYPIPYPELNAVLQEFVESVQTILGDTFIAAWLQGSFAVGDFDQHSDVDFIIVVEDELSEDQVHALQVMHARIFSLDCAWAQCLEGSYFPKDVLRGYSQREVKLWYLDNGHRSLILDGHCNTVVVRSTLLEHGIVLAGPDPTSLIDPIPQLRQWVKKIFHLHGKCCTIKWDVIRQHGIGGPHQFAFHRTPGFGDCNWTDVISELRWAGYKGSIDIEGWHDPVYKDDLEMTGQVHALHYLKNCRGGAFIPNPA